jgi:hypothetical protein
MIFNQVQIFLKKFQEIHNLHIALLGGQYRIEMTIHMFGGYAAEAKKPDQQITPDADVNKNLLQTLLVQKYLE